MSDDSFDSIEHLDMQAGRIERLAIAAAEVADEKGEEVETAVLIVKSSGGDHDGSTRVYYLKSPDEVLGLLTRAQHIIFRGTHERDDED